MTIKRRWTLHPKDKDTRIRNLLRLLRRELRRGNTLRKAWISAEARARVTREALRRRDPAMRCHMCDAQEVHYDIYSGGFECTSCEAVR
jgi:hypothetical protein